MDSQWFFSNDEVIWQAKQPPDQSAVWCETGTDLEKKSAAFWRTAWFLGKQYSRLSNQLFLGEQSDLQASDTAAAAIATPMTQLASHLISTGATTIRLASCLIGTAAATTKLQLA